MQLKPICDIEGKKDRERKTEEETQKDRERHTDRQTKREKGSRERLYRAFHILPQINTANHATFTMQMYAITEYICGNL